MDFLTKTLKKNECEVPQYYIEHSHEPIIPSDEWDAVQKEFAWRKALGRSYSGNSVFASRIICGDCGGFYGSTVWNSTDKYRRTIWQCNAKFKGEHKFTTPHLTEEDVKARFLKALTHSWITKRKYWKTALMSENIMPIARNSMMKWLD